MPSAHHQHDVVDLAGERHRVDHLGERRRVEHHVVGEALGLLEQRLRGRQREHLGEPVVGAVDQQHARGCRRTAGRARARPRAPRCRAARRRFRRGAWTPSASPTVGRRKSASIRITRLPASASEEARLIAVVVLPSEGDGPVTRMERLSLSARRWAASIVRSVLKDSSVVGDSSPGGRARRTLLARPEPPAAFPERERARALLLGHPRQDGQAVELAQLLLAPQARVERAHREGAADAEDQAGEDPGGEGERRTRREGRRRSAARGSPRAGWGRPSARRLCSRTSCALSDLRCPAPRASAAAICSCMRGSCSVDRTAQLLGALGHHLRRRSRWRCPRRARASPPPLAPRRCCSARPARRRRLPAARRRSRRGRARA